MVGEESEQASAHWQSHGTLAQLQQFVLLLLYVADQGPVDHAEPDWSGALEETSGLLDMQLLAPDAYSTSSLVLSQMPGR